MLLWEQVHLSMYLVLLSLGNGIEWAENVLLQCFENGIC
jgi:hypothetical protein